MEEAIGLIYLFLLIGILIMLLCIKFWVRLIWINIGNCYDRIYDIKYLLKEFLDNKEK